MANIHIGNNANTKLSIIFLVLFLSLKKGPFTFSIIPPFYSTKYIHRFYIRVCIETQFNHDFLPNVITIEPYEISSENLVGKFYVRVKSHAFSSYTLYYYTFNDYDSPLPDHTVISMKLEKGHIIQDFFQNNKKIKVYSFENTIGEGEVKHDTKQRSGGEEAQALER